MNVLSPVWNGISKCQRASIDNDYVSERYYVITFDS